MLIYKLPSLLDMKLTSEMDKRHSNIQVLWYIIDMLQDHVRVLVYIKHLPNKKKLNFFSVGLILL